MALIHRDAVGDATNVSSTFSSFNKCMTKDYCKIPFIVICVVVGLSVLSTLWCLFRCCLCGYRCCACCCGGCGGRRERRIQREQLNRGIPEPTTIIVQQPSRHEPLQYAYFDSQNDDALPIMPSLEKTQRIKVAVEQEHELDVMRPAHTQSPSPNQRYGYDRPAQDPRYPGNTLQHPALARGYGQDPYGMQMPQDQEAFNTIPPPPSTVPHPFQGAGYQTNGIVHHGNRGYMEPSGPHQDPQRDWNGQHENAYNDYQGSRHHQHRDIPNYDSSQRQQEWAIV